MLIAAGEPDEEVVKKWSEENVQLLRKGKLFNLFLLLSIFVFYSQYYYSQVLFVGQLQILGQIKVIYTIWFLSNYELAYSVFQDHCKISHL